MMGLVSLFTDFSSEMMNPLLPIFISGLVPLGWGAFYVGLMEGIAEATASLLKLFSGRISDRLGKRKALVLVGYGVSSLVRPAMALAAAGWQVVTLKFADRVGKGVRTSPRDALIGDSVGPEHRGLAFSFHRAMDHSGAILGPLTALGILFGFAAYYGVTDLGMWRSPKAKPTADEMNAFRLLFAVALVPGIAAMSVLFGKVREIVPRALKGGQAATLSGWRGLSKRFYVFVGIVTLFALGNSSDMFLLLYAWTSFKLGLVQIIGLWVLLHFSKVAFSLPGGIISDRLGRRPVIIAGWIVYALVYLGFAEATAQWEFWTLFIIYGFYHGMTEGVEKALVADFIASEHRGTAYGVYHGAVGLAMLPASLMFGVFWLAIGPRVAFTIGAALAGTAAVLMAVLLSGGPGRQEAPQAA